MLTLRPMREVELDLVREWLADRVVARWYLVGSSVEDEIGDLRKCIVGAEPREVVLVSKRGAPIV